MTVRTKDQQTLFIHVPKTGGTSVVQWMKTNLECNEFKPKHCTHKYFVGKYGQTPWSFAIVRNPWDMLVSVYHYNKRLQKERLRQARIKKRMHKNWDMIRLQHSINFFEAGFTHFILSGPKHWHPYIDQQVYYTHGVDCILRFENLQKDFQQIQERVGCHSPLPRLNKSDHKHYSKYYNKVTRNIVADYCSKDIGVFGYEF